jgi:hypothetical protein
MFLNPSSETGYGLVIKETFLFSGSVKDAGHPGVNL